MSDTSGGRSGTRSCWWMVDQICADSVWPPTPECVVLQALLQLTCMWACGTPTSSVHRECCQFRGCDAALSHCGLQIVLVSLVLPTRTPKAMMKLPIEDLLGILVLSIRMTCPHHRSCAVCRSASIPLMLHILSTVVLGTCSCHLMFAIFLRHRR